MSTRIALGQRIAALEAHSQDLEVQISREQDPAERAALAVDAIATRARQIELMREAA